MGFYLTHLLEATLLFINALAILNEQRFLRRYSIDRPAYGDGVRHQISILLYAVRTYLRLPLVALNVVVIFFELLVG